MPHINIRYKNTTPYIVKGIVIGVEQLITITIRFLLLTSMPHQSHHRLLVPDLHQSFLYTHPRQAE